MKKVGTLYDLPILVGLLAAAGQLKIKAQDCAFVGELSLSGKLRPAAGILPMALHAKAEGIRALFVPSANAAEATLAGGPRGLPRGSRHGSGAPLYRRGPSLPAPPWSGETTPEPGPDFSEVKGQDAVKRALEIAAAGGHNILMVGPRDRASPCWLNACPPFSPISPRRRPWRSPRSTRCWASPTPNTPSSPAVRSAPPTTASPPPPWPEGFQCQTGGNFSGPPRGAVSG